MAEPKRYFWLKLQHDFFNSKRIKKLRRIAGGDTYTIIYLKMQLLAVKNDGILQFTGLEKSFAEELALDLDEDVENVQITLQYLQSCGLMETSDDTNYVLPYTVQNTGSETAVAQRVRAFRNRKMLHCNTDVTDMKQICNGEIEIEKEIEIELEKDITISNDIVCQTDVRRCIDEWNVLQKVGIAPVNKITPNSTRYKNLKARIKEYGVDEVIKAIQIIERCPFLQGKSNSKEQWVITFDWFVKPNNFPKVYDGNYLDNKQPKKNRLDVVDTWE